MQWWVTIASSPDDVNTLGGSLKDKNRELVLKLVKAKKEEREDDHKKLCAARGLKFFFRAEAEKMLSIVRGRSN
jgi:hypothetical protein